MRCSLHFLYEHAPLALQRVSINLNSVIFILLCLRQVLDDALRCVAARPSAFTSEHLQQAKAVLGKHKCRDASIQQTIVQLADA